MRKRHDHPGSGQALLADFQTAMVSRATIEAAHHEASRSENALVEQLTQVSGGAYLQPGTMSENIQQQLTRDSLDAHIKKVQADQLEAMSAAQLQELGKQSRTTYRGRKIKITVMPGKADVIESIWYSPQRGHYSGNVTAHSVTGIIDEVALEKNMLILRPTTGRRLLSGGLQHYLVYVIDPATLSPLATFDLL